MGTLLIIRESFSLPFRGGEIWCEHLDGLSDRLDIVEEKFNRDLRAILRPSTSALIALDIYGTRLDQRVAGLIIEKLAAAGPKVRRMAIIGASRAVSRILKDSLKRERPRFAVRFVDGFELGKEWLIP